MGNGFFEVPIAVNEPVKSYAPGSAERKEVLETYKKMYDEKVEVPLFINGKEVKTKDTATMSPPHDHKHVLADYHLAGPEHVQQVAPAREVVLDQRREHAFAVPQQPVIVAQRGHEPDERTVVGSAHLQTPRSG